MGMLKQSLPQLQAKAHGAIVLLRMERISPEKKNPPDESSG
jgi:hypothetical protein